MRVDVMEERRTKTKEGGKEKKSKEKE